MKKLLSKKRLKKINKALKNPVVKYLSGTVFSFALTGIVKERKKSRDNFYSEQEAQL